MPSARLPCRLRMLCLLLPAFVSASGPAWSDSPLAASLDFEQSVRPILARACAKCHGGEEPQADLNLTSRAAADASGVLSPGRPDESELLRRIGSNDPEERMPPGESLTADEIALLQRWIAEGANWPAHWAYEPLQNRAPPEPQTAAWRDWSRTPIDSFIAAPLEARGLAPSPEADRRTLLRRLSFDLLGLPPTPAQVQAFLNDRSPDAYETLVETMLASPHYGERWARHWMDLVHFAETHGQEHDSPREHAWPYRDYLVASFNADKPYSRFVQEQVAGDVLFPDDVPALIATAFLAAGPFDASSLVAVNEDSIDRLLAQYLDRDDIVTTVMSTFTSSSVHCARCHDHKFDPISQAEYYGLQAVFAAIDKANRSYDADPEVRRRRRELLDQRRRIARWAESGEGGLLEAAALERVAAWETALVHSSPRWTPLEIETRSATGGSTLSLLNDGSLRAEGPRPERDVYVLTANSPLPRLTALRLQLLTDDSLPQRGPGRADNGNLHLMELEVALDPGDGAVRPLRLANARADFNQENFPIAGAIDGNPNTFWGIHPEVGKPHDARFELESPLVGEASRLRISLHQTWGGGHLIGRFRLLATDAPLPIHDALEDLPAEVRSVLETDAAARTEDQRRQLIAWSLNREVDEALAALPPQQQIYCGSNQFTANGSFRPAAAPRPIHILQRGEVTRPGAAAVPGALRCVPTAAFDLPEEQRDDERARRAALARWLGDEANVLTWRSIVNRIWQHHFGRGLVETANDFGQLGAPPSHPELLDWLAVRLLDSGGSLKSVHREILLSAVYRQSSAERPECSESDAGNRLLWRQNRRRLDAEQFHDALLVATGLLDRRMQGPSVKQFLQTPSSTATPNVDYLNFDPDDPGNFRRSVYRFVFRTVPDPFMNAMDCPDASQLTPQRTVSVTALQALATLNDKFVVRQSQRLAKRLETSASDAESRIAMAYDWLLNRAPTEEESRAVLAYAEEHGLANACRVLMNLNEFLFVD